jgi:hypothetical protein
MRELIFLFPRMCQEENMPRSRWSLEHFKLLMCGVFVFGGLCDAAAQNPDALSPFFEG